LHRMHMGSIDSKPVRELVEEILEGGKDAFEMRAPSMDSEHDHTH